jgi:CheY-like chemotaxis protein
VLIVEDDADLRNVAMEVMTDLDFTVLQAGDGEAAQAVLAGGVTVDLLFTDVVLPGPVGGLDLVDLARVDG